jgi:glutaminase
MTQDRDNLISQGKIPLTIEQAINYLREHQKTVKEEIKKQVASSQISIAPVNDRIKYLTYCISLLEEVDEDILRLMPVNIRTMYSRRELAEFFRWFLTQKIYFATDERLAKETGVPLDLIKDIDAYAQEAVFRAIKHIKQVGIPIVGGAN